MKNLTMRQRKFVDEYLIDFNATQAYKRAGYSATSDLVAGVNSHKLLKHAKIQALIQERQREVQKRNEISQDWVLEQLKEMYNKNKDCNAPGSAAAANKALELIGKHIGMFTERVEHSGQITEEVINMTPEERTQKLKELLSKVIKDPTVIDNVLLQGKNNAKS